MAVIIFDMDGTIADSFDYVSDFLAATAHKGPLSTKQKEELRGMSMVGMARKLGYKWWQGPMLVWRGRRRMKHAIKDLKSFSGIPELIRKLNAEGHELFIVSINSVRNIRLFLHHQKIHKYFLQIYGGVGVFGKPMALRQLLREHHIDLEHAVYVGDEIRDIEAAKIIGMRVVAVSWGFASRDGLKAAKPAGLADTPAELMRILEEI
jgi:phosphoglycolate phosphatase